MKKSIEKQKQARLAFKEKMILLRKRRMEIFENISKKIDTQQLESLKKKLHIHE